MSFTLSDWFNLRAKQPKSIKMGSLNFDWTHWLYWSKDWQTNYPFTCHCYQYLKKWGTFHKYFFQFWWNWYFSVCYYLESNHCSFTYISTEFSSNHMLIIGIGVKCYFSKFEMLISKFGKMSQCINHGPLVHINTLSLADEYTQLKTMNMTFSLEFFLA